ncbi:MAG: dihydroorotate dehydrogenase electron transfer subunit [Planctomycetaceae bacterium]|jgi:dihydroorotate dehydrogenase electron transfer subunit|nr:dihydroorotate dehydrogenase electron transfer subunit [Planctomycetaceae bacterium]
MNMFNAQRKIWHGKGIIESNLKLAEQTFHLTLNAQGTLPTINAGQFVMLRLQNRTNPLLGRPFAVYRVSENVLEVIYLVVGKMTQCLAELRKGDTLDFWTPLGNGFSPISTPAHIIMVAGGIGQTPFLMLAEKYFQTDSHCTLLYGTQNAERIICVDDFKKLGVDIHLATDDGSCNSGFNSYHGFVTDLISQVYQPEEPTQIFCCGPRPMLSAAFQVACQLKLPCEVSLETSMSCGLGICFGCVVQCRCEKEKKIDNETESTTNKMNKIVNETWDYRRTCIDGPVFDAYKLCW